MCGKEERKRAEKEYLFFIPSGIYQVYSPSKTYVSPSLMSCFLLPDLAQR